ncbi:Hypothetical protein CINCED_3A005624 [Cinara cedri]|nr:Hypothetical protein CINCED_3A005624 [Cinara cedri]
MLGSVCCDEVHNQILLLQEFSESMSCWKNVDVLSRKVLFNNIITSINELLRVPLSTKQLKKELITRSNAYELSNLMNTVLNCEYTELNSVFVKQINDYLKICKPEDSYNIPIKDRKNNFIKTPELLEKYRSCTEKAYRALQSFTNNISEMLLTLTGILKNMDINYVSDKQNYIQILMNWYLHLYSFVNIEFPKGFESQSGIKIAGESIKYNSNKMFVFLENYVDTMKIIGIQTEIALKEYYLKNCPHSINTYNTDKSNTIPTFLETVQTNIAPFVYHPFVKTGNVFNMYSDKHITLLQTIKYNNIFVASWENDVESLAVEDILNNYVKPTKDIRVLLKYELLILDLMENIVYARVLCDLENIIKYQTDETINSRYEHLQNTFKNYLSKLQSSYYPSIFVKNMIQFGFLLKEVIFHLTQTNFSKNEYGIKMLEQIKFFTWIRFPQNVVWYNNISNTEKKPLYVEIKSLADFLNLFVIDRINDTYLNRGIMNLLCGKSCIIIPERFEYAVDYKIMFFKWETELNSKCETCTLLNSLKPYTNSVIESSNNLQITLKNVQKSLIDGHKIEKSLDRNLEEKVQNNISDFKKSVINLKVTLIEFFLEGYEYFISDRDIENTFRKMLFTYIFNVETVVLFEDGFELPSDVMSLDSSIHNLKSFHSILLSYLELYYLLLCENRFAEKGVELPLPTASRKASIDFRENNVMIDILNRTFVSENKSTLLIAKNLESDISRCFNVIKLCQNFISSTDSKFDGHHIRLSWYGKPKTVGEVNTELFENIFDLQDIVEYQLLIVRWIMCSLISRLLKILNHIKPLLALLNDYDERKTLITKFLENLHYVDDLLRVNSINSRSFSYGVDIIKEIIQNNHMEYKIENIISFFVEDLTLYGILQKTPSLLSEDLSADLILKLVMYTSSDIDHLRSSDFPKIISVLGLNEILSGSQKSFMVSNRVYALIKMPKTVDGETNSN